MRQSGTSRTETEGTLDIGATVGRLLTLLVVSGLIFATGVFVSELWGELAHDIDFKPFFLVYLLVALVGFGGPTLAIGLGAAMGEGMHDLMEGYEADEPLGFVGFVAGFAVFGWLLHRVAPDPTDWRYQTVAAVVGAFVQALFEGFAFVFKRGLTLPEATVSVGGNTVTHGLLLGAIPLVVLFPVLNGRLRAISVTQTRDGTATVESETRHAHSSHSRADSDETSQWQSEQNE